MAQILQFHCSDERPETPAEARPAGEIVAMAHVNLASVVETVRVMRALNQFELLDHFNGWRHAARQYQG